MQAESNVTPVLHSPRDVQSTISSGDLDSNVLSETIAALASESMWRQLWLVADSLSREVSVLFDRDGRIWVDIGTAGHVRLSPPVGATIPFSLWIHTHPWDAYWSPTDLATLASYSQILDEALVLGHDHLKRTVRNDGSQPPLAATGPLSSWTSEGPVEYDILEGLDGR